jgi:hypothetical protein
MTMPEYVSKQTPEIPECEWLLREVTYLAASEIASHGVGMCPCCGWHGGTHSGECVISQARRYLARASSLRRRSQMMREDGQTANLRAK